MAQTQIESKSNYIGHIKSWMKVDKITGWDYIKYLIARKHCGEESRCISFDMLERPMIVSFLSDNYGKCSTVIISLSGSPPKGYAVLSLGDNPIEIGKDDVIVPKIIMVCDGNFKCRRYEYWKWREYMEKHKIDKLHISDLLNRKDVTIISNLVKTQ